MPTITELITVAMTDVVIMTVVETPKMMKVQRDLMHEQKLKMRTIISRTEATKAIM